MDTGYDVIIIGAGAAGLMAANELTKAGKKITVLEAKNRMGGRIHTVKHAGFSMPIELGAEFEHGKLELTNKLVKASGTDLYKIGGKIWRQQKNEITEGEDFIEDYDLLEDAFKELKKDMSVAEFFYVFLNQPEHAELKKTLKGYVEGYNAADIHTASALTLKKDLENSGNDQYRINGGYTTIIDYLAKEIKKAGTPVLLNTAVQQINWKKDEVIVYTTKGDFTAPKVILTVSLGVLQQELIRFHPEIPSKINLAKSMGFGNVIKSIYQFKNVFWEDKNIVRERTTSKLGFLFTEEPVPTWWSQHPKKDAIFTGWIGGPDTKKYQNLQTRELAELGLASLASIYSLPKEEIKNMVVAFEVVDWAKDMETGGAYSYDTVGGEEKRKQLAAPVEETIFFAGEALAQHTETGTVEAALESGKHVVDILLNK